MAAGFFFILVTAAHFPSYLVSFTDIAVRHEQNLPAAYGNHRRLSSGVGSKTIFGNLHKYKRVLSDFIKLVIVITKAAPAFFYSC